MTKQEFLAMSLPYDVKAIDKFECIWTIHPYKDALDSLKDNEHLSYENFIKEEGHKLILHPLPDLTKEIEHKGKIFKPSFVLSRDFKNAEDFICLIIQILNGEEKMNLTKVMKYCPLNIVQKLLEWHFDIADLISKREAIDVNSLDVNPYK